MTTDPRPIPIRIANQRAYIWDVDDIAVLRSQHRLCGILAGTLPHLSQQNVFLGVPLLLMPEEVVLLVEKKFAVLVDDPKAHQAPTAPQLQKWEEEREEFAKRHIVVNDTKINQNAATRSISEDAMRKRKERMERKAARSQQPAPVDMIPEESPAERAEATPAPDSRPSTPSSNANTVAYPVIIESASSTLEWYDTSATTYDAIEAAQAAGIWSYPSNLSERARCGVFRGLWEQGYFLGGGIKFGGDYLVYPGDPLRFHSHFVATVIESPVATLRPMEIVAHGRLGTATKKSHLLCGWNDEKKDVSYLSIEWAGFG
ncbi:tRNA-intron endonuclease catalytic domain-like protein [Pleurotus eryngii]|uniref:tRNA-splicing endonuclease subunit Sen34 n=1 Tax=Pleurotus eryngii TaxID=5323 RepID=A0A9P6DH43_PLEER|nr:tRNA-intron endonuclease catalytic domain-like protein [Pleurotus eryngii]